MKRFNIIFWMLLIIVGAVVPAKGQTAVDTAALFRELAVIQTGYQQSTVSFDLHYTYASELQPGVVLDSMNGNAAFYKGTCHYQLENMETIAGSLYNVVLFHEEKLMYVALAGASRPDPLDVVRGMLARAGVTRYNVADEDGQHIMHLYFAENGPCREMTIITGKTSHQLQLIQYIVRTELLMQAPETGTSNAPDPRYGPYAIVKGTFDNYHQLGKEPEWTNAQHFFHREGEELVTAGAFNDFKIFKASPNL